MQEKCKNWIWESLNALIERIYELKTTRLINKFGGGTSGSKTGEYHNVEVTNRISVLTFDT